MTVKITKPALNLREELAALRNQGGAYEESKFYIGNLVTNGLFGSDVSGWTGVNSTTSLVGGKLRYTSDGIQNNYPKVKTSLGTLQAGSTYVLTVGEHSQVAGGGWVRCKIEADYSGNGFPAGDLLYNAVSVSNFSVNVTINTTQEYFLWMYSQDNGSVYSYEFDNISIYETDGTDLIHSTPHGYSIKDIYIDGELAREGSAYDYTVHDGYIKPTIAPTATTETCLIGVRT